MVNVYEIDLCQSLLRIWFFLFLHIFFDPALAQPPRDQTNVLLVKII